MKIPNSQLDSVMRQKDTMRSLTRGYKKPLKKECEHSLVPNSTAKTPSGHMLGKCSRCKMGYDVTEYEEQRHKDDMKPEDEEDAFDAVRRISKANSLKRKRYTGYNNYKFRSNPRDDY